MTGGGTAGPGYPMRDIVLCLGIKAYLNVSYRRLTGSLRVLGCRKPVSTRNEVPAREICHNVRLHLGCLTYITA